MWYDYAMEIPFKKKHPGGRPTKYSLDMVKKAEEYLALCIDEVEDYHATRGEKSDSYKRILNVNLPTIEGLALHLGIRKDTVFEWEKIHEEFSDFMVKLRNKQADVLQRKGLSGDYNPVIAKVLLTKHGYRDENAMVGKDGGAVKIQFDPAFNDATPQ